MRSYEKIGLSKNFLQGIEPKYNLAAVTKIVGDEIDHECIYTIAGFVAYVLTCSPTGMRIFAEPLKRVETLAVSADEQGLIPPPPKELGGMRLAELLSTGDIKIMVDPKYPQAIGISSILRLVATFGSFK